MKIKGKKINLNATKKKKGSSDDDGPVQLKKFETKSEDVVSKILDNSLSIRKASTRIRKINPNVAKLIPNLAQKRLPDCRVRLEKSEDLITNSEDPGKIEPSAQRKSIRKRIIKLIPNGYVKKDRKQLKPLEKPAITNDTETIQASTRIFKSKATNENNEMSQSCKSPIVKISRLKLGQNKVSANNTEQPARNEQNLHKPIYKTSTNDNGPERQSNIFDFSQNIDDGNNTATDSMNEIIQKLYREKKIVLKKHQPRKAKPKKDRDNLLKISKKLKQQFKPVLDKISRKPAEKSTKPVASKPPMIIQNKFLSSTIQFNKPMSQSTPLRTQTEVIVNPLVNRSNEKVFDKISRQPMGKSTKPEGGKPPMIIQNKFLSSTIQSSKPIGQSTPLRLQTEIVIAPTVNRSNETFEFESVGNIVVNSNQPAKPNDQSTPLRLQTEVIVTPSVNKTNEKVTNETSEFEFESVVNLVDNNFNSNQPGQSNDHATSLSINFSNQTLNCSNAENQEPPNYKQVANQTNIKLAERSPTRRPLKPLQITNIYFSPNKDNAEKNLPEIEFSKGNCSPAKTFTKPTVTKVPPPPVTRTIVPKCPKNTPPPIRTIQPTAAQPRTYLTNRKIAFQSPRKTGPSSTLAVDFNVKNNFGFSIDEDADLTKNSLVPQNRRNLKIKLRKLAKFLPSRMRPAAAQINASQTKVANIFGELATTQKITRELFSKNTNQMKSKRLAEEQKQEKDNREQHNDEPLLFANSLTDNRIPRKSYTRIAKRKRYNSFSYDTESEDDEEQEDQIPKKKPESKKSKKDQLHEMELNKFAEEFNSMCEDVEQFELIVEKT